MGNHSAHVFELGLGVFGSVPCDFPGEVVRDALVINFGPRSSASFSGVSVGVCVNHCELSAHDWPLLFVARSSA